MSNNPHSTESIATSLRNEKARRRLLEFTKRTMDSFEETEFHKVYYSILHLFATQVILNLIITIPPQHGKSTGATMNLPAFMFGINPDLNIAISSYSTPITQRFNRNIQRIIDTEEYREIFPEVNLGVSNVVTATTNPLRNASEFEIVDTDGKIRGKLISVGRGGALTSQSVDIWIGDDLYKDYSEGNSPVVRDAVWEWYVSVPLSRQPKQKLKVNTRWHEDDSIGRIEKHETVVEINCLQDVYDAIDEHGQDVWMKLNFEAIKTGDPTEFDTRKKGESLWEKERPLKNLKTIRALDPEGFNCLYQGDPQSSAGLLYPNGFKTYSDLPKLKIIKSYTDTADSGADYLCSIVYGEALDSVDDHKYILDVLYTQEGMDVTEGKIAAQLNDNKVNESEIESNNGGRYFAINVEKRVNTNVTWFHQSKNKESRIYSNSATVMNKIIFPSDWHSKWPEFYNHLTKYKKNFKANKHDDAPDVVTGIIEKEDVVLTTVWE